MTANGIDKTQDGDSIPAVKTSVSKAEHLQELVDSLVSNLKSDSTENPGRDNRSTLRGRTLAGFDLKLYKSWLAEAHTTFRKASQQKVPLTYASEWVLDNYYIIRQAIQQVEDDLPISFYKQLPKLKGDPRRVVPRIYVIARDILAFQNLLVEPVDLQPIMVRLQERVLLTIGELWAFPIFLRYSLIEALSHLLVSVIRPPQPPEFPGGYTPPLAFNNSLPSKESAEDETANNEAISNIILSLRSIFEQDWSDFFESVSSLERKLRTDPAGIYSRMDFKTRDLYRKEIENLSFTSGLGQNELTEIMLELAQKNTPPGTASVLSASSTTSTIMNASPIPETFASAKQNATQSGSGVHIGELLFGKGRMDLEQRIGYKPAFITAIKRLMLRHASGFYLSSIMLLSVLFFIFMGYAIKIPEMLNTNPIPSAHYPLSIPGTTVLQLIAAILICFTIVIPALTIATSLVNWLITLIVRPRILPKMNFKGGIPGKFQTLVVIPALITSHEDVESLVQQLELHYLRNSDPGLLFALLTDFKDADSESLPEDEKFVKQAINAIGELNKKYGPASLGIGDSGNQINDSSSLFYFLHRKRLWNPSEGKWIGWERKRGKLHELNQLLRGGKNLSFTSITDGVTDPEISRRALQGIRYVITLDTDTILPSGAAHRLAGALAHPLNQAVFDDESGKMISGYTILQPRMEIHPKSVNYSWFTRIFAGDAGLDLYTLAVSDSYQDVFGEGSYVGKGIYDVDAFMRSVDENIPENSVLSHDLLEGVMGRAGLVTDITMIEDYPENYLLQSLRMRRWIRGDWQLLPWLFRRKRVGLDFSAIDRWKMFDNLRRSLLAPALVLIFVLGLIFFPGSAGFWTAIVLITLAVPLLTGLARSGLQILGGENLGVAFRPLTWNLIRGLLAVAFLPYEAYFSIDAILTTLYRLLISRRNLLQWTTAAQTTRLFGLQSRRNISWQKMSGGAALGVFLLVGLQLISTPIRSGLAPVVGFAFPILVLWLFSPIIAWWISRPITERAHQLNQDQVSLLRQITRRTWGFFERFVGPEDHWLPPDHYQESPVGTVAHRTSPTNIGLLLTSTLAAYDLGYLDQLGLATRLATTMETLGRLERFRGHFMNWYDTLTLKPLRPRYISTVDSGNLAASLIITAQACKTMPDEPIFRWDLWQGYLDTLSNLTETLTKMREAEFKDQVEEINHRIMDTHAEILSVRSQPERWYALYLHVSGPFWQDLSHRLMELVIVGRSAFDLASLEKLQEVSSQIERHHLAVHRTITELVPWIPLLANPPALFLEPRFKSAMAGLRKCLPSNIAFRKVHSLTERATHNIEVLQEMLRETFLVDNITQNPGITSENLEEEWLEKLVQALAHAKLNAQTLISRYAQIKSDSDRYVNEMDFGFLYHKQRRVFHIGLNLNTGQLDQNFYDLLASEARIASIVAIAKGDVPQSHWMYLGRPVMRSKNSYILLSWSGTMFEYLMPPLFLRSYPGTLLAESTRGAVSHQIAYGKAKGVPWGISESGFYRFDANQNYQYRAFGVPGLGFKRGLGDDLVISPYSSLIAIGYEPHAVAHNLANLIERNIVGLYGVYESIDFTTDRLYLGETSVVVKEYMAHHQGMILMAMANYLHEDIMVERMHRDPRIQSIELLLQEQTPRAAPTQDTSTEDVKGVQRVTIVSEEITPWRVPIQTAIPQVNLLSNGRLKVMISNMGGGYTSWRDIDLTRWQPDGVLDPWGTWIYIQELESNPLKQGRLWSLGYQPIPGNPADMQVTYFAHMAVIRRTEKEFTSTMEVTVAPDDPVEIRRIHLNNDDDFQHTLRLTSYGEVILAPQNDDTRHPSFNKLFIESEFVPGLNLQIFKRRLRSDKEHPIYMGHMLVAPGRPMVISHEADRAQFIGRGQSLRKPAALTSPGYLSGTTGATIDPIFSLGQVIKIDSHSSADLAYLTFAAESREAILALAKRFRNWTLIENTFRQANIASQVWLGKQGLSTNDFQNALKTLSALIYSSKSVRTSPETIAANRLGQPGLWRFGISGDYPILLVEVDDPKQMNLAYEVLQVHQFLRTRRFKMDLVILNQQPTNYGAEISGMIYRLVSKMKGEEWLHQRGGVFILYADQMGVEERNLLQTAANVFLNGSNGSLSEQIPEYSIPIHHLPDFIPTRPVEKPEDAAKPPQTMPIEQKEDLLFHNGFGGFSADGSEYVIDWNGHRQSMDGESAIGSESLIKKSTPAPWVNVIGYPGFGFMVSESGSQCTWALNSSENRLTPWSNDPLTDPTGEALYLRDEETGEVWTPTPLPAGADQPYRVTHGAGYTNFEHNSHGLRQMLRLFASPEDPVKIIHLKVENTLDHTRRITATQYIEWVLGTTHAASMSYIIPEYDAGQQCLLATNPFSTEFGTRTAFLIASKTLHGLTADRTEFLGRGRHPSFPAALHRLGLETRITPGEDPCAVLQIHLDLLPGASEEVYFILGQGNDREHALSLAKKYHDPVYVGEAFKRTGIFWNKLLGTLQVNTPEPAIDLILNRWMLYQTLSCRIWGRTGFYQSSGAFGFRDQLQDVLALLTIDPAIVRNQLLNAAQRQFEEGDVLHWWHPPTGRGVRTRFSDDLLWLPYTTAMYLEVTGDMSILDESLPFLEAPVLAKSELERYGEYPQTRQSYSLKEHCLRAIEKGMTKGTHGLPLMGAGDWNDGMNRVGVKGQGESVWLGWFLCDVLNRFSEICKKTGDLKLARKLQSRSKEYTKAIENAAWDGSWYLRAIYDDGKTLGSILNSECQIDSIAQSWSVLGGAANQQRSRQAMNSVLERLVRPQDRLMLLLAPPFDKTAQDPGYIKAYLPGARENGGQYTHAAIWAAWAFANMGNGNQAGSLFDLLNPVNQSDSPEKAEVYRVEPYAIAGDIYSQPPNVRRGGWTWYTGSAAWMYRLGLEAILGFKKVGSNLMIDPVIPSKWDGFELHYRFGETKYAIRVKNPDHVERSVRRLSLDGRLIKRKSIHLVDDGNEHEIEVILGEKPDK